MNHQFVSAEEAIQSIKSRDRVFIHGSAATPHHLLRALAKASGTLQNVELIAVSTLGEMEIAKPEYGNSFYFNSLFVSDNVRVAINSERGEYIPIFLSEIAKLFEKGILKIDVALINVSPPDKHGFCSLGTSVDVARSAVHHAKRVIAQINPNMPRTHGDSFIHVDKIDSMVSCNDALPEVFYGAKITETDLAIGRFCAGLIEDRSTLQMGIGCIPDAVLQSLDHCKDLGVHTEMFSDGVIDLLKKGVITNRFKKKHPEKVVSSFAIGSKMLYDFIDDNPQFEFLEADYVMMGELSALIRK